MRPGGGPAGSGEPGTGGLRLFFALQPDAPTRAALAALARAAAQAMRGRAPPAANLHLTLAFLGQQPAERLDALAAIGAAAAKAAPPFVLTLDRVGAFRGAGIGWAGCERAPGELQRLVGALNAGLAAAGFPVEPRPFQAHVTLVRRGRRPPEGVATAPLPWRVERLALMASETFPDGPRYREVGAWPLGAGTPTAPSPVA